MGYVYFFKHDSGSRFKIGMTASTPEKRLAGLRVPSFSVYGYFKTKQQRFLEKELHRVLAVFNIELEYFSLRDKNVDEILTCLKNESSAETAIKNLENAKFVLAEKLKHWDERLHYFEEGLLEESLIICQRNELVEKYESLYGAYSPSIENSMYFSKEHSKEVCDLSRQLYGCFADASTHKV